MLPPPTVWPKATPLVLYLRHLTGQEVACRTGNMPVCPTALVLSSGGASR